MKPRTNTIAVHTRARTHTHTPHILRPPPSNSSPLATTRTSTLMVSRRPRCACILTTQPLQYNTTTKSHNQARVRQTQPNPTQLKPLSLHLSHVGNICLDILKEKWSATYSGVCARMGMCICAKFWRKCPAVCSSTHTHHIPCYLQ